MKSDNIAEKCASKINRLAASEEDLLSNGRLEGVIQEACDEAAMRSRFAALTEAAEIASFFSINQEPIHPDLTYQKMSSSAQIVYHTTCQQVAQKITNLRDNHP